MFDLKPMLCHEHKDRPEQIANATDWIMERKLDGWRFLFHVTDDGVRSFAGRNGSDRSGQAPDVEAALSYLPNDTILDAELVNLDGDGPTVATALAHGGNLQAVVFDVLRIAGSDVTSLPWNERRDLLEKAAEGFDNVNVTLSEIHLLDDDLHQSWLDEGFEGSVVKRMSARYAIGRRSRDWLKIKPQTTDEAEIIGFQNGTNGNSNLIGIFEIRMLVNDAETTIKVPTDQMRDDVTADPEAWRGRVVEIAHHGLMKSGKPRHPMFARERLDRDEVKMPQQRSAPIEQSDYIDSPARSASGNIRNLKQMGDAKFSKLMEQMIGSDDLEAVDAVLAEARRREI